MNGKHPAFEQRRGVVIGVVSLFTYTFLTMASFKVPLQSAVKENGVGTVTFASGWMVEPGGKLKLNTPYGGK